MTRDISAVIHLATKLKDDALVGMVMAQQQISVANGAKHALEEKNAGAQHCMD